MNETRKGRKKAEQEAMRIEAVMCRQKPNYALLGHALLPAVREFFQDPKNEAEFQEWMRKRAEAQAANI